MRRWLDLIWGVALLFTVDMANAARYGSRSIAQSTMDAHAVAIIKVKSGEVLVSGGEECARKYSGDVVRWYKGSARSTRLTFFAGKGLAIGSSYAVFLNRYSSPLCGRVANRWSVASDGVYEFDGRFYFRPTYVIRTRVSDYTFEVYDAEKFEGLIKSAEGFRLQP